VKRAHSRETAYNDVLAALRTPSAQPSPSEDTVVAPAAKAKAEPKVKPERVKEPIGKERRPSRKERKQRAADVPLAAPMPPPVAPPSPKKRAKPVAAPAAPPAPEPVAEQAIETAPKPQPRKRALRKEPRARRGSRRQEARQAPPMTAAPSAEPVPTAVAEPEVEETSRAGVGSSWEHPLAPQFKPTQITPPPVYFKPRRSAQRLATVLLLCTGAVTGLAGWVAYDDRTTTNLGTMAILAVLTLIIWAFKISSAPAVLKVENGILEIEDTGRHYVWDLRSPYTPIEVFGRPGRRKWRVWMHRPGSTTYVITSAIVDPNEFMKMLRAYRPEL
jgi:hypothetical protein